jgi:hypothetical protein
MESASSDQVNDQIEALVAVAIEALIYGLYSATRR